MRVAIDVTAAATQHAGIGRAVRELVGALLREPERPDLTLVYTRRGPAREIDGLAVYERVRVRRLPLSPRAALAAWHKARLPLPIEALIGAAQVFHGPDFTLPPLALARGVLTVHDLSYLTRPQDAHPAQRRFLESAVPRSIGRARSIVAVSEATKRDLMEHYGLRAERIHVVPNAVPAWFGAITDAEELAAVRRRLELPATFVLSVGTIHPRKNIAGLAQAAALAARRLGDPLEHLHVGSEGWRHDEVYADIARAGARVRFLGFLDDRTLRALYTLAAATAFPSHAEGFGIPVLEAFACGCPVVASDTPAVREVAGEAAVFVDPARPEAIADGLVRVVGDRARREALVQRGHQRRRAFSWAQAAQAQLEVYRRTARGG